MVMAVLTDKGEFVTTPVRKLLVLLQMIDGPEKLPLAVSSLPPCELSEVLAEKCALPDDLAGNLGYTPGVLVADVVLSVLHDACMAYAVQLPYAEVRSGREAEEALQNGSANA